MILPFKSFYFMRHALTDYNLKPNVIEQPNIPLNSAGQEQARKAQKLCESLSIQKIYYSPLLRTLQTMQITTKNIVCPKISLPDIQERCFGYSKNVLEKNVYNKTLQYSESLAEFKSRIEHGISTAISNDETVLFISHGDVYLRLCDLLEIDPLTLNHAAIIHLFPENYCWQQKLLF